jgi:hypothetical protein
MWKKKSIFWELEYWKFLEVRSAIDVMHVMKNLCVNLLGFLGLYGKTKDTPEACEDQHHIKRRDDMHPEDFKGPASYALTKEEKEIFFKCLVRDMVPISIQYWYNPKAAKGEPEEGAAVNYVTKIMKDRL